MKNDLVSIITPCYNGSRYIAKTIESVLDQTYSNWEMIIVDDGSKDNSAEIVSSYSKKDNRIHLLQQQNSGSAAARNKGIKEAKGRYIALLDADDLWYPDFLEKQIDYLNTKNAVCVCCSYIRIDENGKEIMKPTYSKSTITLKDMRIRNYIGCLSGLYDAQKYGKIYLHEELKSLRDDYAYWYDIVSLEGKAYGNPEILAKYRVFQNSTTGNKTKLIKKQYLFYRNYLKENPIEAVFHLIQWGIIGVIKFR